MKCSSTIADDVVGDDLDDEVTCRVVVAFAARACVKKRKNSISKLLTVIYPDYEWLPWKFKCPQNFWDDIKNQRKFIDWAGKELGIKDMNDWYKVTIQV